MKGRNTGKRITVTILGAMYLLIGIMQLIEGAAEESRFYYLDNILIRVMGFLFILASFGVIMRKEAARKALVIICIISIFEVAVTLDTTLMDTFEIITVFIFTVVVYIPPIIVFELPEMRKYMKYETDSDYEYASSRIFDYNSYTVKKNSGPGTASFIIALINILLFIALVAISQQYIIGDIMEEEIITASPLVLILGILYIVNAMGSLIGFGLGVAGVALRNRKKIFAAWGMSLNLLIFLVYIVILIAAVIYLKPVPYEEDFIWNSFRYY